MYYMRYAHVSMPLLLTKVVIISFWTVKRGVLTRITLYYFSDLLTRT